ADERREAGVRHEVVEDVRHQRPGFERTLGTRAGRVGDARRAKGGAARTGRVASEALDIAGASAAFEFDPPVRRQLVAEAGEAENVILRLDIEGVRFAVRRVESRGRLDFLRPMVAEVKGPIPTNFL